MMNLKNKIVVITGAANGLGKALATEFYRRGCHLALLDVDFNGLEKVKNGIENGQQKITIHQTNVSNEQDIIDTRLDILNHHPCINILVNNAGISISQFFEQTNLTDFKCIFNINFFGTVYCTKHFLPDLKQQPDGRLVNIISDFAFMGFFGKTAYGSSKSAVLGFTNSLKIELHGTNVKVCFVVPPPLDTGLVKNGKHIDHTKRENEAKFIEKNSLPLDKTAKKIVKQISKGKYRIIIGTMMFWVDIAARLFPTLLHRFIGINRKRFDFV